MADGVKRIAGPQFTTTTNNREGSRRKSSSCSRSSSFTELNDNNKKNNSKSSVRDMYIYQNNPGIHHHLQHHPQQQQHQQQRRLLPKEPYGKQNYHRNFHNNKPLIPIREGSEESLQLLSAFSEEEEEEDIMLPPLSSDSYTHNDQVRIAGSASSVDFSEEDEEEEEDEMSDLLLRLQQSQARMEHIKRMLVNQRGFIVESLKKIAETQTQLKPKAQSTASTMTKIPINIREEPDESSSYGSAQQTPPSDFKICPMCEVPFPSSMDDYDFESHVLDHFSFNNSSVGSCEEDSSPSSNLRLLSGNDDHDGGGGGAPSSASSLPS